jgi:hypothetical protein
MLNPGAYIYVGHMAYQTTHYSNGYNIVMVGLTAVAPVTYNITYNHGLGLSPGPVHAPTYI